jgi:hypothetical protein
MPFPPRDRQLLDHDGEAVLGEVLGLLEVDVLLHQPGADQRLVQGNDLPPGGVIAVAAALQQAQPGRLHARRWCQRRWARSRGWSERQRAWPIFSRRARDRAGSRLFSSDP